MWWRWKEPQIETGRLILRLPRHGDFRGWSAARAASADYLKPWEPRWSDDHLSRSAYRARVHWSRKAARDERAYPFFIFDRASDAFLGAVTLDNIRRGPAQMGTVGYWMNQSASGQGYMTEALSALVEWAFRDLGLSRIEAGCLPENEGSKRVLEGAGFTSEGAARAYLKIDGAWRDHLLFAALSDDRT
ncbi:MAG: GNAT family protein [Pseudomonadota bacterium]